MITLVTSFSCNARSCVRGDLPQELQGVSVRELVKAIGESRANGNGTTPPRTPPPTPRKVRHASPPTRHKVRHASHHPHHTKWEMPRPPHHTRWGMSRPPLHHARWGMPNPDNKRSEAYAAPHATQGEACPTPTPRKVSHATLPQDRARWGIGNLSIINCFKISSLRKGSVKPPQTLKLLYTF